jgi:dipeptidyl aminopeptidase/acylaminoacyl peptidase
VPELRDLLEARTAKPAGFAAASDAVYVLSDLTGTFQLYRVPAAGGELEQLTDLPEPVLAFPIPGRQELVISMDAGGNEREQLYLHSGDPFAELEPLVVEPDFLHRAPQLSPDGTLLASGCNRRNGVDLDVYLRVLDDGAERRVFDRGGMCSPAGFSPDGLLLAVHRPTERSSDDELWLVDLESGEAEHVTPHEDEAEYAAPQWVSPGAFLCASNEGRETFAIRRYDVEAREWTTVLESGWDLSCWVDPTGETLLVEENADGYSRLELRDARTLELRRELPLPGRGVLGMPYEEPYFSPDGRLLAYQYTSPLVPGDVWLADVQTGETRRLTRSPNQLDEAELTEPELHRFPSFDGESIPVFLFEPRGGETGPPPVVFLIHGGPEAQLRPVWQPLIQYFVSHGLAVAAPNVRGSTGYGKRYQHLDDVELRLDSVHDLAALHDALAEAGRIDRGRAVLYGGSYGGYMVLAGLAFQPERWAAGIELVGISSLVTFLENTAEWRRKLREREYGSLERDREFLLEASPLTRVDEIRAPLFVIHGANDPRVPVGEARQIHRSLTERGIRCELLIYDDEGHGLKKLPNKLDAYPRAAAFLDEVLA